MVKAKVSKAILPQYPWAIERDYLRFLLSIFDDYFKELFKNINKEGFKIEAPKFKSDSVYHFDCQDFANTEEFIRNDLLDSKIKLDKQIVLFGKHLFEQASDKFRALTAGQLVQKKLKLIGRQTSEAHYKIWEAQARQNISVNVFRSEPWLLTELEAFTEENVRLIRNISDTATNRIQTLVTDAVKSGQSASTISVEIQQVLQTTEARASLIAADQVGKLNGTLSRIRQTKAGLEEYEWMTVGDERVRLTHKAQDGKTYSWENPPKTGHPGMDYRCRCQAIPKFPEEA